MICKQDVGFAPRWLMEASLPCLCPYGKSWLRQSSRLKLTVESGEEDGDGCGDMPRYVGVPNGTLARRIIAWLTREVVRTGSPDIELGLSSRHFFSKLGLTATGGKRGTIAAVRLQMLRLFQARFHVEWGESSAHHGQSTIDVQSCLDDSACGFSWPLRRQLTLSTGFFNALREHAVPFDWEFFQKISKSTIAVDLYWLLSSRASEAAQVFEMSWSDLAGALGTCSTPNLYAPHVMRRIKMICAAAGFEVMSYGGGLVFKRSRLSFQDPVRSVLGALTDPPLKSSERAVNSFLTTA